MKRNSSKVNRVDAQNVVRPLEDRVGIAWVDSLVQFLAFLPWLSSEQHEFGPRSPFGPRAHQSRPFPWNFPTRSSPVASSQVISGATFVVRFFRTNVEGKFRWESLALYQHSDSVLRHAETTLAAHLLHLVVQEVHRVGMSGIGCSVIRRIGLL